MTQPLSRRERLRAEALAEIVELALAQVAEGGPAALSLNAIASQRAMEHILVALHDLAADGPGPGVKLPRELDSQLRSWAHDRGAGDDLPPWLLRLAIVTWQRMHGHIALELEGVHAAMGISSDALYRTELDAILAEATERS